MMKFVAVVALASGCVAPLAAQQRIPLELTPEGIASARASVDGSESLFILDSGVGVSAITPALAAGIGCTPWGRIVGHRASGERLDIPHCNAATIQIGTYRKQVPLLGILDLPKLMGPAGTRLGGAIGLDAFDGSMVTLSVARNDVTVETPQSLSTIQRTAREIPVRLVREAQGASLTVAMGVPTPKGLLWMELDTGGYAPVRVDRAAAPLLGLDPDAKVSQPLDVAIVPEVRFTGTAIVQDLVLDGVVGREMLQGWDVTLDLANGRGWMRPSGTVADRR